MRAQLLERVIRLCPGCFGATGCLIEVQCLFGSHLPTYQPPGTSDRQKADPMWPKLVTSLAKKSIQSGY